MPLRSSRLLPVASTSAVNWEPAVLILRSIAARSVIISDASRRRVRPTTSRGSDRGQQGACLGRGQELLRPTRQEFQQESVQPVHGVGARGAELVPAIHQQPKRDQVVVGGDLPQRRGAQRDNGDGVRIGGVGLAALPGGEHPGSRRQLRGNVHDRLPIGDQALRDVLADAVAPFDRPDPIGPPAAGPQHVAVAVTVCAEATDLEHLLTLVEDLDCRGPLVRVHPDHYPAHQALVSLAVDVATDDEEGSATSSWTDPS